MAEIFGTVTGAIGVLGVAAQCADGIRKLRAFCDDVKNAPEELAYIANELEILTHNLRNRGAATKECTDSGYHQPHARPLSVPGECSAYGLHHPRSYYRYGKEKIRKTKGCVEETEYKSVSDQG